MAVNVELFYLLINFRGRKRPCQVNGHNLNYYKKLLEIFLMGLETLYHALNIIHPDILTSGGILENKKIGDMAQEYNIAMAVHMAESPIAAMAAVHSAAATENFLALEYHSEDVGWWDDIVEFPNKPIVNDGYIKVPDEPGLGIKALNDEVIKKHIHPDIQGLWEPTTEFNVLWSNDRTWS